MYKSLMIVLFAACSGVFYGLAFVRFQSCLIGLVPLIVFCCILTWARSILLAMLAGGITGVLVTIVSLHWLAPLALQSGWQSQTSVVFVLGVILLSLGWACCFGVLCWTRKCTNLPWFVIFPFIWISGEWVKWWMFYPIASCPFPLLQLGHLIDPTSCIGKLAQVFGVWGVTYIVCMVVGSLVDMLHIVCSVMDGSIRSGCGWSERVRSVSQSWIIGSVLMLHFVMWCIVLSIWFEGRYINRSTVENRCSVVLVSGISSPEDALVSCRKLGLESRGMVFLWPESGVSFLKSDGEIPSNQFFKEFSRDTGVTLIIPRSRVVKNGNWRSIRNSLCVFGPGLSDVGYYDKVFPVPWREFVPGGWFHGRPQSGIEPGTAFPVFDGIGNDLQGKFSLGICFDVAFPVVFRKSALKKPGVFFVASSEDSDSTGTVSVYMARLTQYRALECGRAIVRNVESGVNGVFFPDGSTLTSSESDKVHQRDMICSVPFAQNGTIYLMLGESLPVCCFILTCLLLCYASSCSNR